MDSLAPHDPDARLHRLADTLLQGWAVLATEALLAGDLVRARFAADEYQRLLAAVPEPPLIVRTPAAIAAEPESGEHRP